MSETVAVALIAVLGTLGSGLLGYIAARRNTEVQLTAIEVEVDQLRATQAKEAKDHRQRVYEDFVSSTLELELLLQAGYRSLDQAKRKTVMHEIGASFTRIELFGEDSVVAASRQLTLAIADYLELLATADHQRQSPSSVYRGKGFMPWKTARDRLLAAMRQDLGTSAAGDKLGPESGQGSSG